MSKEIAVKASLDIGDNATKLLEQLGHQVGVTTDKLFPWYVKQQIVEGYTCLVLCGFALLFSLCGFYFGQRMKARSESDEEGWIPVMVISGMAMFFCLCAIFLVGSTWVSQVMNPEYHAAHKIIKDAACLIK